MKSRVCSGAYIRSRSLAWWVTQAPGLRCPLAVHTYIRTYGRYVGRLKSLYDINPSLPFPPVVTLDTMMRKREKEAETDVEVAIHVRITRVWNLTFGLISHVIILPRFRLPRNPAIPSRAKYRRGCCYDIANFHDVVDSLQHRSYLAMPPRHLPARVMYRTPLTDRINPAA